MVMLNGKSQYSEVFIRLPDTKVVDLCPWKKLSLTSAYGPGQDLPSYQKQQENKIKYMKQLFSGIKQAAQACGL